MKHIRDAFKTIDGEDTKSIEFTDITKHSFTATGLSELYFTKLDRFCNRYVMTGRVEFSVDRDAVDFRFVKRSEQQELAALHASLADDEDSQSSSTKLNKENVNVHAIEQECKPHHPRVIDLLMMIPNKKNVLFTRNQNEIIVEVFIDSINIPTVSELVDKDEHCYIDLKPYGLRLTLSNIRPRKRRRVDRE